MNLSDLNPETETLDCTTMIKKSDQMRERSLSLKSDTNFAAVLINSIFTDSNLVLPLTKIGIFILCIYNMYRRIG